MRKLRLVFLFAIILQILFSIPSLAWEGKVVGISDGDTIRVMHEGKGERVRLYGVDCPEKGQDFGQKAKMFTSNMVFGKGVEIKAVTQDRYGRTVGFVYLGSRCLNEELIKSGFAWVYRKYCDKPICDQWRKMEENAKASKIGLWSQPNPIPPWEFRHGKVSEVSIQKKNFPISFGYHGNINSKVFHKPDCQAYNCKNCTAFFRTRDEALEAGYKPCGICKP